MRHWVPLFVVWALLAAVVAAGVLTLTSCHAPLPCKNHGPRACLPARWR